MSALGTHLLLETSPVAKSESSPTNETKDGK